VKRGLICWDQKELPRLAFEKRLDGIREEAKVRQLPALVIHTDIWKSNQGRLFSNVMPYWNRALLVVPQEGEPVLLCGLSPRVYPWIRSVTVLTDIRPGTNLAQALLQFCAEKQWRRIGALDFTQFPYDLYSQIGEKIEVVDVPSSKLRDSPDVWELPMYRTAVQMARDILEKEFPSAAGSIDYQFSGNLERKFRLAGAEDLVIRMTNGQAPPELARGVKLGPKVSVSVALEYRGHWVKIARTNAEPGLASAVRETFDNAVTNIAGDGVRIENLSGLYPYESCALDHLPTTGLIAISVERNLDGHRVFYGDTCLISEHGAQII
jgi:hypothetical protein